MIELRHQFAARPVPELEDRRHQPDARHVRREPIFGEQFERRRMGGRGARIGLRPGVVVEQTDAQAAPAEQPGAQQSDRSAARNEHQIAVTAHAECLFQLLLIEPPMGKWGSLYVQDKLNYIRIAACFQRERHAHTSGSGLRGRPCRPRRHERRLCRSVAEQAHSGDRAAQPGKRGRYRSKDCFRTSGGATGAVGRH